MPSDDLIGALTADLRPVRRVASPAAATLLWAAVSAAILGAAISLSTARPNFSAWLMSGDDKPELAIAAATALLASFAAFQLAIPGRDRRWAVLPAIAGFGWLTWIGVGCWNDLTMQDAVGLQPSPSCFAFIAIFGTPVLLLTLYLTRHAAVLRPWPVALLAGLAASASADVGLAFVDHPHAPIITLVWHGAAALLLTGSAVALGPWWMRRCAAWGSWRGGRQSRPPR